MLGIGVELDAAIDEHGQPDVCLFTCCEFEEEIDAFIHRLVQRPERHFHGLGLEHVPGDGHGPETDLGVVIGDGGGQEGVRIRELREAMAQDAKGTRADAMVRGAEELPNEAGEQALSVSRAQAASRRLFQ